MMASRTLRNASRFTPDGRLKTATQAALDNASPFMPDGRLKTDLQAALDAAARVERDTGTPTR